MQPQTIQFYDWFKDLEPQILDNLNELLVAEGIDPVDSMHGGFYKDGKWVRPGDTDDYRNYWHLYLELWGERIRNDSYDEAWFPNIDDEEEWDYLYECAEEYSSKSGGKHVDTKWPRHLVTAVRKMLRDNGFCKDPDGQGILIWWSW